MCGKLFKYKENNTKICNTFDHNFKNIPLYTMRKVSLERYYFVLYDGALTLKMSKMVLNPFCDKTLHLFLKASGRCHYPTKEINEIWVACLKFYSLLDGIDCFHTMAKCVF